MGLGLVSWRTDSGPSLPQLGVILSWLYLNWGAEQDFPPPLVIPQGTDHVTALALCKQHTEDKRKYYECINVKKALQRHIQDAIEDKYLESLVNDDTQLIQQDIPDVLAYLFETYGKIPSKEVKQKEAEICTMTFHPADPMILLYNPIEQLEKMAQSAQIPYTSRQSLDIALTVLRNTRDFERALSDWELKPQAQKTWSNFKTHFTAAQKQLKAIRGPTMQQAGYHQVNLLAQQFKDELDTRDQEIMTILKTMDMASQASPTPPTGVVSTLTPATHQVKATTSDMQLEMINILRKIQEQLEPNTTAVKPPASPCPRQGRKTPDDANFCRNDTSKYCWTHGACGHAGRNCNFRAPGYCHEATFTNRMGGSNAFCNPQDSPN